MKTNLTRRARVQPRHAIGFLASHTTQPTPVYTEPKRKTPCKRSNANELDR